MISVFSFYWKMFKKRNKLFNKLILNPLKQNHGKDESWTSKIVDTILSRRYEFVNLWWKNSQRHHHVFLIICEPNASKNLEKNIFSIMVIVSDWWTSEHFHTCTQRDTECWRYDTTIDLVTFLNLSFRPLPDFNKVLHMSIYFVTSFELSNSNENK